MKAKTYTVIHFRLNVSLQEAEYLQALTQNYLGEGAEDPQDSELRGKIFMELSRALEEV